MCKGRLALSLVCLTSLVLVLPVSADQNPLNCAPASDVGVDVFCVSAAGTTNSIVGQPVVVGQTILYQGRVFQTDNANCGFEGGQIDITTPDGVLHDTTLGQTIPLICGSTLCAPLGLSVFRGSFISYTVRPQDVGTSRPNVLPCNPVATDIQATATYTGGKSHCDAGDDCDPSSAISACNPVRVLGLRATKQVECTTGTLCSQNPGDYSATASGAGNATSCSGSPSFCYSILVTNTGTAALQIDSANDDQLGNLLTQGLLGGLPPGVGSRVFIGPSSTSTTVTDHLTVLAHETVSCQALPTNASAQATANVIPSCITCDVVFQRPGGTALTSDTTPCSPHSGSCTDSDIHIKPGNGDVTVVVRAHNTAGNGQAILNGQISGNIDGVTYTATVSGSIAAGSSADTTVGTVHTTITDIGCHAATADLTFDGALSGNCPPITTSCNNRFEICGTNCATVVKVVKCLTTPECLAGVCDQSGDYASSATGVEDAGFCYKITITNCGQLDFTSVSVKDTVAGDISSLFPTTLAAGASATATYEHDFPGFTGTKPNTVTFVGTNAQGSASATANASVTLQPVAISCQKSVSVNGGPFTAGGTIDLPSLSPGQCSTSTVAFMVHVCNNGDVDLTNVQITDTGVSGCPAQTFTVDSLPSQVCTDITLCTTIPQVVLCCTPGGSVTFTNVVNVSAQVSTNVCSINPANCQTVTATSACTNTVTIVQPCVSPSACRTTGGGKQFSTCQADFLGSTAATIPTYVTHGGQVGAPFAVATVFTPNTPCIRGEWTHVRHVSPKLNGNFHAASNGHEHDFDSLQCACLACSGPSTVTTVVNTLANHSGTQCTVTDLNYIAATDLEVVDGICNPDSKKNGCGPLPAPSPANKICFSGAGHYTRTNSKRDENVVFRVDVEDRSEPGGTPPGLAAGGTTAPPDRYRFRLWIIKGNEGGSQGNPTTTEALALRQQVACQNAHTETVCARPPDIDDGGNLDRGNRQLHKVTGAPIPQCPPDGVGCVPSLP